MIQISKALRSLYPDSEFVLENEDIDCIVWVKNKPSGFDFSNEEEKVLKLNELQIEDERLAELETTNLYQRKRAAEYPPMTDYLDAIVKGDITQQQAYISACLAVKAKYPK